ncbi:MAG: hypothetical protein R3181_04920, partial [Rubricoccaceae bacterium]|nr:hypothetical protein [Rubricoccaceae bacterium]
MRTLLLPLSVGLVLSLSVPAPSAAQDGTPVIYMTQYKIHPSRMDSLATLIAEYDIPWHNFVAENVEGYQRRYLRHDTGNEYNLMIATAYPDWDMVRGDEIPFDELFPRFAASMGMTEEEMEEDGVNEMFQWAYEGAEHVDQIWRLIGGPAGDDPSDMDGDPVIYMSQYKIHSSRMDSLATLITEYDIPWHNFVAENVEGYQRRYLRHDTGNEYNLM